MNIVNRDFRSTSGTALSLVALSMALASCTDTQSTKRSDPLPTTQQVDAVPVADVAKQLPVLTAAGYGTIIVGRRADDAGYGLADDGAYTDACRTWSSDELPSVSVMVDEGYIRRVTISSNEGVQNPIRTERAIGVGSTEAQVRAAYPVMGEQPHKYEADPAKNLFFGEEGDANTMRFEIGTDGKVRLIHVGESPWVSYVESCS